MAIFVELVQGVLQAQLRAGELQLLDQGGGGEVAHAHALLGQSVADGGGQMGLAHAAGAEQQDVACLAGPVRGAGQGLDLSAGKAGNLGEVEARQALADGQVRFLAVTGDAPAVAIGELLLAQCAQVLGAVPAVALGFAEKRLPVTGDAREPQLLEHQG